MRSKLPDEYLVSLLRRCYTTPGCLASRLPLRNQPQRPGALPRTWRKCHERGGFAVGNGAQNRSYQTLHPQSQNVDLYGTTSTLGQETPDPHSGSATRRNHGNQPRIAVIGGGITGLATAYYLTKEVPRAKVVLYEKNDRLGGWLQSKQVEVENGTVLLEQGPRTLRHTSPAGMLTLRLVSY